MIEEKTYTSDDGCEYRVVLTLIDAAYANDTVNLFCSDYDAGVFPILGRDKPSKNQALKEFSEYKTKIGTVGYLVTVDHYKDRMAPVLRREWVQESGQQRRYHFNAPLNTRDSSLKELTVETRRKKTDQRGNVTYYWYRPGNARNELWDLLGYGHAAVEMIAWSTCVGQFALESVDWSRFWDYLEQEQIYYTSGAVTNG